MSPCRVGTFSKMSKGGGIVEGAMIMEFCRGDDEDSRGVDGDVNQSNIAEELTVY